MAAVAVVRPVHFLPGREAEAIAWAKETESIRQRWGMQQQLILKGAVDRSAYMLVQVWESMDAYQAWRRSPERARLSREGQRFVLYDPSDLYDLM
ncbi:MAG: antibiotic biosynthesis monooxygenase [Chloroflexi bacterium]|nr:antibiotic biosynthesis monooxygenase [Chloroflexota bacterium]